MVMKYLISMPVLIFLAACSTTSSYKVPTARVLTSETNGSGRGNFMLGYHQAREVSVTTSIDSTSVASSTHSVDTYEDFGGVLSYGIFDRLDLGITVDLWMPSIVFGKFQVLGAAKPEADAGNFSFSLLGGIGNSSGKTETSDTLFTTQHGTIITDSASVYQVGGLLGYRFSKAVLFTAGATYSTFSLDGRHTLAGTTTAVPFHDQPKFSQAHFGFQFATGAEKGDDLLIQPMIYRGFLKNFGKESPSTTFSLDIGCHF
jgi:hypothetical protein